MLGHPLNARNWCFIFRLFRLVSFKFVFGMKWPKVRGNFVDTLRLYLRGGPGGAGHPKYGGIGGQGGNIYFEAKIGMLILNSLVCKSNNYKLPLNEVPLRDEEMHFCFLNNYQNEA